MDRRVSRTSIGNVGARSHDERDRANIPTTRAVYRHSNTVAFSQTAKSAHRRGIFAVEQEMGGRISRHCSPPAGVCTETQMPSLGKGTDRCVGRKCASRKWKRARRPPASVRGFEDAADGKRLCSEMSPQ